MNQLFYIVCFWENLRHCKKGGWAFLIRKTKRYVDGLFYSCQNLNFVKRILVKACSASRLVLQARRFISGLTCWLLRPNENFLKLQTICLVALNLLKNINKAVVTADNVVALLLRLKGSKSCIGQLQDDACASVSAFCRPLRVTMVILS